MSDCNKMASARSCCTAGAEQGRDCFELPKRKGRQRLLSSEVGSEGIDLQFARVVINYDLPWNPMRVEQRIGRIDRLGQKAEQIHVWNLFYGDTIDDRIYSRLFERLGVFRGCARCAGALYLVT